jgi:UDP-N-acetylmuramate dehydrogenase
LRLCGVDPAKTQSFIGRSKFSRLTEKILIQDNVPLAPLTTLQVGGPARYFVRAESEDHVIEAFDFARANDLNVFILGGGSNILVSDNGFDGLVLQIASKGISQVANDTLVVAAGEDWDSFVSYSINENFAGIECLSGIPGTVGGTPVQNVGAYGQEVAETITAVRCFDRVGGHIVELSNERCGFSYRSSIFNTTERDRYIVLSVTYRLVEHGEPKIAYKDLVEHFMGSTPTLAEARDAVLSIRRSKSMVIDRDDPNRRSAGSFFKNPIVDRSKYDEIARDSADAVPHFPASQTAVKIPAAWLIEHSGFHKGFVMGNAGISSNHTLAIINRGGANAAEIIALKNAIQSAVSSKFGIDLVPEPFFVGEF